MGPNDWIQLMQLTITMKMDGAAFEENSHEAAEILQRIADDGEALQQYPLYLLLRDHNGNTCTEVKVEA